MKNSASVALIALMLLISCRAMAATPAADAPSMGGVFGRPLTVNPGDHAVVMEYEAWFGPNAITFYGTSEANPVLQSSDMVGVNGCPNNCGYDSEDPKVIARHVSWLRSMGIDAVTLDDTNDIPCIYNSDKFAADYVYEAVPGDPSTKTTLDKSMNCNQVKPHLVQIHVNNANLYRAWDGLRTPLKIIPLLGAADPLSFVPDPYDSYSPHRSALEKQIALYGDLIARYPAMSVIYENKPLIILFVAVNAARTFPLIQKFLKAHPELTARYTFRVDSGYLDSQPHYWASVADQTFWTDRNPATPETPSGPTRIDPRYGFWSQVDRFNTSCTTTPCKRRDPNGQYATYPFFPTYSMIGSRVENFTAAIATAGVEATWGAPATATAPAQYYEDDSLRWDADKHYVTLNNFMRLAVALRPTFLFVLQFNEFGRPDEGFDANTSNDMEPANLWGHTGVAAVRNWVVRYRDMMNK